MHEDLVLEIIAMVYEYQKEHDVTFSYKDEEHEISLLDILHHVEW